MKISQISDDHLTELVQEITREVLKNMSPDFDASSRNKSNKPREKRGRPKSQYQGQLHLKVLEEDEEWFKEMVRKYQTQNGKFFSLMRKYFELAEDKPL